MVFCLPILCLVLVGTPPSQDQGGHGKLLAPFPPRVYSVELFDRAAGYRVDQCAPSELEGVKVLVFTTRTILRTGPKTDLDDGNSVMTETYWVDEATGKVRIARQEFRQGELTIQKTAECKEGVIEYQSASSQGKSEHKQIEILDGGLFFFCQACPAMALKESGESTKTYERFHLEEGSFRPMTVKAGAEALLRFHEKEYQCRRYTLTQADPSSRKEIWMDEAGVCRQIKDYTLRLTFKPAPPEMAEKLAAAEAYQSSFFPLALDVRAPSVLSYLHLRVVIDCPCLKEMPSLARLDQTFEGTLEEEQLKGIFKIKRVLYDQGEEIPIAEAPGAEALIQSVPPEIRKIGAEATQDLKKRRHAVHALGTWILTRITQDPSGPSEPLLVLKEMRACAEGMAGLHVALCRGQGIPARMVKGLAYQHKAQVKGFTPHTWSEVGTEKGWLPVDVAMGEVNFMNAGHVSLGEVSTFSLKEAEILDYIPSPPATRPPLDLSPSEIPLSAGSKLTYGLYLDQERVGSERVEYLGIDQKGEERIFLFTTEYDHKNSTGKTYTRVGERGRLHAYKIENEKGDQFYEAKGGQVLYRFKQGESVEEKRAVLSREGLFYDSSRLFQLGFMLSRLSMEPGRILQVDVFLPNLMRPAATQVEYRGVEEVSLGDKKLLLHVYEVMMGFNKVTVYLDDQGIAVGKTEQNGRVVVMLEKVE